MKTINTITTISLLSLFFLLVIRCKEPSGKVEPVENIVGIYEGNYLINEKGKEYPMVSTKTSIKVNAENKNQVDIWTEDSESYPWQFSNVELTRLDNGNYFFKKLYEVKNGQIVVLKGTINNGKLNYTTEYSVGKGSGILTVEGEK